ncbi:hypothetical protein BDM02DRAFT_3130891 [Thelephora ganbajun]|uniref:Uncharacterized protein n=1 Tax=Thelephora ganbajun TaxID=370292 RepID=A0ACB6Z7U3_THEGA|nr:hypothetical protein BDM02DRAFT_3130891 [Thelephora ganbajun]
MWLTHRKKQRYDVCKHLYSFAKAYASDTPKRLTILLVLRRLVQQFFTVLLFGIRAVLAACIADVPRPPIPREREEPSPAFNAALFSNLSDHPAWKSLAADIFLGQVIASLIAFTFMAVFLLREWVSQDPQPGVFEGVDVPPQADAPRPNLTLMSYTIVNLMSQFPLRSPLDLRPHLLPHKPQYRRTIHRRAVPRRTHEIRSNGNLDEAGTDGILNEEGNPKHLVRFRSRLNDSSVTPTRLHCRVYPPHFKYEIVIFTLTVWFACCIAIAAVLARPVLLGRRLFLLFTAQEVHDGYSFVVGHRTLRSPQATEGERISRLVIALPRQTQFIVHGVLPGLRHPDIDNFGDGGLVHDPKLVEMWVLGLFYTKIILQLPRFEAPQRMNEGIQGANGHLSPSSYPMIATKVIGLAVEGLLAMLAFPAGILWMFRLLVDYRITDRALYTFQLFLGCPQIFYTSLIVVGICPEILTRHGSRYLGATQRIREIEFLVEMSRSLEPEETKEKAVEKKEQEQEEAGVGDLPICPENYICVEWCITATLLAPSKILWPMFQRGSGSEHFADPSEDTTVGFPPPLGWVNRKDDLFESTDELFIEQDGFHLFSGLTRWTIVRTASHGNCLPLMDRQTDAGVA